MLTLNAGAATTCEVHMAVVIQHHDTIDPGQEVHGMRHEHLFRRHSKSIELETWEHERIGTE